MSNPTSPEASLKSAATAPSESHPLATFRTLFGEARARGNEARKKSTADAATYQAALAHAQMQPWPCWRLSCFLTKDNVQQLCHLVFRGKIWFLRVSNVQISDMMSESLRRSGS